MFSLSLYCCVRNSFLFWARWQCNIKREITLIRTFKIIWAYCDFYVLFEWILEINWLTRKFELLEYYELLQYLWFIMGRLQMHEMLKHIIGRSQKLEILYRSIIKGWSQNLLKIHSRPVSVIWIVLAYCTDICLSTCHGRKGWKEERNPVKKNSIV